MSAPRSSKHIEPLPGIEYATPVPPIVNLSGKPKLPFTQEELDDLSKPKVLISGGGIGGLTLALLLHKANIPFLVLERAKEIKPLEFLKHGKHVNEYHMFKEDLNLIHTMQTTWLKDAVGYDEHIISRPDLYNLLWSHIPRERILLGKRILSFSQNEVGVLVRCADNSSYHGDILVGADGAYSAVRQQIYKDLKAIDKLPAKDDVTLPFSCVCLVGQTETLDPEEFPVLKEERSRFDSVLGVSTMCTWATMTTKHNTVCWVVIQYLDKYTSKQNDSFRCSEWGPEAAEALAREVRVFKLPGTRNGQPLTLGDYVDRTPRNLMAKVVLEEIVFDTWYSGRAVLLGDSCHKLNPSGASGAVTAIHDAVTLANWLSTLRSAPVEDIEKVFAEYRSERYPVAKEAFVSSQMFARNLGKSMISVFVRGLIKRLPQWLWRRIVLKMFIARHQASFLPLVEDKAKVRPSYQPSLHKTLPILKKLANSPAIEATGSSAPVTI
ncbi:hypothetical protein BG003_010008 [Podila horticola]|nr:hypothetical protein BG003_010008 [Podila horticola]